MQVQDFTVIRISPIVYNDRDILEIGVISHRPQSGHTNTHIQRNKILQQQQVMLVFFCFVCFFADTFQHTHTRTHPDTRCSNSQDKESPVALVQNAVRLCSAAWRLSERIQAEAT